MEQRASIAGLEIQRADVGDAGAILALQRLAYQGEATLYGDPNLPPMRETEAELVAAFETHVILKAVVEGVIVGAVRVACADRVCMIGRLMVDPPFQGRGIGSALLRQAEATFPEAEQWQLFTGARSAENIRLYRRHGYTVVGTEVISDRVSIVIMVKRA